jgi:hypothetical protein
MLPSLQLLPMTVLTLFLPQICELSPSTEQIESICGALNPDNVATGVQHVVLPTPPLDIESCALMIHLF